MLHLRTIFALALLAALFMVNAAMAVSLAPSADGAAASIDPATGNYTVTTEYPAWRFSGTLGAPLTDLLITSGQDKLGIYREISFKWKTTSPLQGSIRQYESRSAIRFAISSPQAISRLNEDFPAFTGFPSRLHHLSYKESAMSPPAFSLQNNGTPWVLFDDDANTAVLSPGSDFLVSQMHGDGKSLIASGLNPTLANLPAGFTHVSWFVVGQGIESTIHAWGDVLTDLSGKQRPPDNADISVKYLGYWTDNGTTYYYNYDKNLGYAGTILAVARRYREQNIPIHYMQLDSWWYQKSRMAPDGKMEGAKRSRLPEGTWNAYGGTLDYTAHPDLFPQGLAAFQKQLGLPLVLHGRWIDPASDYRKHYRISGLGAVDPKWWDDRADYMQQSGAVIYEQDWLCEIYPHSPEMSDTLVAGSAFTDNMARATRQRGQTLQYCMPLPRYFLQGSLYNNLTTIRTSGDRFDRANWDHFLYTSILADAMRIRPWTDAFFSSELGNLNVSVLSSGPVGTGDAIGKESRSNLMLAAREDGVLVKPSAPLLPTDSSIISDAESLHHPLLCSTYTDNGQHTVYAFAFTRKGDSQDLSFSPASLGLTGKIYLFKTSTRTGQLMNADEIYKDKLSGPDWNLYVLAPLGPSGIALLGDAGKIVGTGRQRIPTIKNTANQLSATPEMSPTEKAITLHGYAATIPTVTVENGSEQSLSYDPKSGQFSVQISVDPTAPSQMDDADPVRFVQVMIRR